MKTIKLSDINLLDVGNTITISGGVWAGNGKTYIVMFPDEELGEVEILQMERADWEKFLHQADMSDTLVQTADGKIIFRKSQRQIDTNITWKRFQMDDYACRYCGKSGLPLTVDHLVLWEDGGPTRLDNLLTSCKKCNKTRGNSSYEEWLNSAYYNKVKDGLADGVHNENVAILSELAKIPLVLHKRSR